VQSAHSHNFRTSTIIPRSFRWTIKKSHAKDICRRVATAQGGQSRALKGNGTIKVHHRDQSRRRSGYTTAIRALATIGTESRNRKRKWIRYWRHKVDQTQMYFTLYLGGLRLLERTRIGCWRRNCQIKAAATVIKGKGNIFQQDMNMRTLQSKTKK
jgi:hypothetical protein